MTAQYKHKQDTLLENISRLDRQVKDLQDQINQKATEIEKIEHQHKQTLAAKEDEISNLKKKINDMSTEFSMMLKETLEKMEERIEMAQWNEKDNQKLLSKVSDDPMGND